MSSFLRIIALFFCALMALGPTLTNAGRTCYSPPCGKVVNKSKQILWAAYGASQQDLKDAGLTTSSPGVYCPIWNNNSGVFSSPNPKRDDLPCLGWSVGQGGTYPLTLGGWSATGSPVDIDFVWFWVPYTVKWAAGGGPVEVAAQVYTKFSDAETMVCNDVNNKPTCVIYRGDAN